MTCSLGYNPQPVETFLVLKLGKVSKGWDQRHFEDSYSKIPSLTRAKHSWWGGHVAQLVECWPVRQEMMIWGRRDSSVVIDRGLETDFRNGVPV